MAQILYLLPRHLMNLLLILKKDFRPAYERLMKKGIVAGLDLGRFYPALSGKYLFCATETVSKEDIDVVVSEVQQ